MSALELGLAIVCVLGTAAAWWELRAARRDTAKLTAAADRLTALTVERQRVARNLAQFGEAVETTTTAVDLGTSVVQTTHQAIAAIPFGILEAIPATRVPSRVIRGIHDETAAGVYRAISTANRAIGDALARGKRPEPPSADPPSTRVTSTRVPRRPVAAPAPSQESLPRKSGREALTAKSGSEPVKSGRESSAGKSGRESLPGKSGPESLPGKSGRESAPGKSSPESLPGKSGRESVPGMSGRESVPARSRRGPEKPNSESVPRGADDSPAAPRTRGRDRVESPNTGADGRSRARNAGPRGRSETGSRAPGKRGRPTVESSPAASAAAPGREGPTDRLQVDSPRADTDRSSQGPETASAQGQVTGTSGVASTRVESESPSGAGSAPGETTAASGVESTDGDSVSSSGAGSAPDETTEASGVESTQDDSMSSSGAASEPGETTDLPGAESTLAASTSSAPEGASAASIETGHTPDVVHTPTEAAHRIPRETTGGVPESPPAGAAVSPAPAAAGSPAPAAADSDRPDATDDSSPAGSVPYLQPSTTDPAPRRTAAVADNDSPEDRA